MINCSSIAIHPNKMIVATGQVLGTDRREAMVNSHAFDKMN